MSKRNKSPMTLEERRILARTQWADATTVLRQAVSELAETIQFKPITIASESPISAAQLTNGTLTIDFLYGPPEFHVEILLSKHHHPHARLGLSQLIQLPSIMEWATSHRLKPPATIVSEVRWLGDLLLGPCAEVFTDVDSFFARFPRNDRKEA
jgi:hypothetical protein